MVSQRTIVLVPFPYSDQTGKKVRPALVISNDVFNKREDVIICALTSRTASRPYSLLLTSKDAVHKNLQETSLIRVDALTRIKKDLILKEIDSVTETTFKHVLQIVDSMFR